MSVSPKAADSRQGKPPLVIFDPGMRHRVCHHYTMSLVYSRACESRFSIFWMTHRRFDPALARYPYDARIRQHPRRRSRGIAALATRLSLQAFLRRRYSDDQLARGFAATGGGLPLYIRDLLAAEQRLGDDGQLLIHSGAPQLLESLLFWLVARDDEPAPTVYLRLMFDDEANPGCLQPLPRMVERLRPYSNVRLYAEMPSLARWIEPFYGRPVPVALYNGNPHLVEAPPKLAERPTVGFLGSARLEKGIRRVPAILDHLARNGPPCDVMVQSFIRPRKNVRQRKLWDQILSRSSAEMNISIVSEHPDVRVHWERMASCSVLVLPYEAARYRRRGSGIALEAAGGGIPFVCPAGTSMADFLDRGNGETAIDDRDFARKIATILKDHSRYDAAARRFSAQIRDRLANDPIVRALMPESQPQRSLESVS